MNERHSDFALLQEFVRQRHQPAFAELVRRHLDLVYATALRKVQDCGAAEEVAQNVFSVLARKAWQFASDDSLPAWLYKTALLESKFWLRGELRRRRREQTAAELGTTMNTQHDPSAVHALLPLLDDALLSLREKDRTALLLRFYESHSLADVGAAFGLNEKAAQKRVHSALEKLSEFFKRRGFKTATVAAAAAALQSTAAPASAALAGSVVSAAAHIAPPALLGLGVLFARLASLSRWKTAGLCLVLAAVPLTWELKEQHDAAAEAKRMRTQFLDAQSDNAATRAEIKRLGQVAAKLEQSFAQAKVVAARATGSARAFETWKKRVRSQLMAADYRWSDESPFARIPKSALLELATLSDSEPFATPGIVKSFARELLGLTPAERQPFEDTLHRLFEDVDSRRAALVYETNQPSHGRFSTNVLAGNIFMTPGLGDKPDELAGQAMEELHRLIGEERWPLLATRLNRRGGSTLQSILNGTFSWPAEIKVWIEPGQKELQFGLSMEVGVVVGGGLSPLSMFLPEGHPARTPGAERAGDWLAQPLRERILSWAQQQAIARFARPELP